MSLENKIKKAHNKYFDALHEIALTVDTIRSGRVFVDELEEQVVKLAELIKREGIKLVEDAA